MGNETVRKQTHSERLSEYLDAADRAAQSYHGKTQELWWADLAATLREALADAQRSADAISAWEAVRTHLLQVYPRPHGCTILPTGNPVPAPDWMVYTHAAPTKGAIGNHTDPMRAVLIAKATLEGDGND